MVSERHLAGCFWAANMSARAAGSFLQALARGDALMCIDNSALTMKCVIACA